MRRLRGVGFIVASSLWTMTTFAQSTPLPDLQQTAWLMLGAFGRTAESGNWAEVTDFQQDFLLESGGESAARPQDGQTVQGKTWKRLTTPTMPVNLRQVFGGKINCFGYAYTEFESPTTYQAALKLGSDDGVKVWFNGELLLSNNIGRALNPDDEALVVTIQTGVNRLLLKINQGSGDWGFAARFATLADEQQAWTQITTPRLALRVLDQLVVNPTTFSATVMTVPALAVQEPVRIDICDWQGNELFKTTGHTSVPIALPLPADFAGPVTVRVTGENTLAQATATERVWFGNPETLSASLVQQARDLADKVDAAVIEADDLQATLRFYADVLEGQGHPTLTSITYRLAAFETLSTLIKLINTNAWNADAFRGLHNWAYRSPIDDSRQPYGLYVPPNYDPAKAYPLIVALHWYSGDTLTAMKALAVARLQPTDFIVVAPFGRGDMGYLSMAEQDVLDVLAKIEARFTIDPNRVYLTGISMGGLGTWRIGQHFAEKFAAIANFCGWTGTAYLDNLRNVATLAVHGDADRSVPVSMNRAAVKRLQELNYDVRYDELPGVDHDVWDRWILTAPGEARLFDYFRSKTRNPWPAEVIVKTNYLRYGKNAWIRLLELANPPQNGEVRAQVQSPTEIVITTAQVNFFAVNCAQPQLSPTDPITVKIDGTRLELPAQPGEVFFQRQNDQWVTVADDTPQNVAAHEGGGFADIFTRPLIIVYGTQQRAAILQKAAELLADWAPTPEIPIGVKAGKFRVKADTAITDADVQNYHLLLLGNPAENLIAQRIAAQLPVTFTAAGGTIAGQEFPQAGIALTYPNPLAPGKLVGIFTLPFTDAEIEGALPYLDLQFYGFDMNDTASAPRGFADVVVFTSLDFYRNAPVWAGMFDHTWQHLRQMQAPQ